MKRRAYGAALGMLIALAGGVPTIACSSGGSSGNVTCSTRGKCPGDQAPTQAQMDQCNATLSGACGGKFQDAINCIAANEQCDADGGVNATATTQACSSQESAYIACGFAHLDAGFTTD